MTATWKEAANHDTGVEVMVTTAIDLKIAESMSKEAGDIEVALRVLETVIAI